MTRTKRTWMADSARLFAISDLHLPGGDDKSMDLFGPHWQEHFTKIREDWLARVGPEDIVLLSGDTSWAMRLEEALPDLQAIGALPGRKVMIKGNHDFWWSSLSRVRASLSEGFFALQNDALILDDYVFCGSRGWSLPGLEEDSPENLKIYQRELIRLELSLQRAQAQRGARRLVALCHFPPCNSRGEDSAVTQLLERYQVDDVVYGHLHGPACASAFTGMKNGVRYWFSSCDCVQFRLLELTCDQQPARA